MIKRILNIIFYLLCFVVPTVTVYELAFLIPPQPGQPGYTSYKISVWVTAIAFGLLVTLLNLFLDFKESNLTDDPPAM